MAHENITSFWSRVCINEGELTKGRVKLICAKAVQVNLRVTQAKDGSHFRIDQKNHGQVGEILILRGHNGLYRIHLFAGADY